VSMAANSRSCGETKTAQPKRGMVGSSSVSAGGPLANIRTLKTAHWSTVADSGVHSCSIPRIRRTDRCTTDRAAGLAMLEALDVHGRQAEVREVYRREGSTWGTVSFTPFRRHPRSAPAR